MRLNQSAAAGLSSCCRPIRVRLSRAARTRATVRGHPDDRAELHVLACRLPASLLVLAVVVALVIGLRPEQHELSSVASLVSDQRTGDHGRERAAPSTTTRRDRERSSSSVGS